MSMDIRKVISSVAESLFQEKHRSSGSEEGSIFKSEALKGGDKSNSLSIIKHTIDLKRLSFIEKSWKSSDDREYLINMRFLGVSEDLNGAWHLARFPRVYIVEDNDDYCSSVTRFISGNNFTLNEGNSFNIGYALGEIPRELGKLFPEKSPFDRGRVRKLVLEGSDLPNEMYQSDALRIRQIVDKFNSSGDAIMSWRKATNRGFCHNDVKGENLIEAISINSHSFYYFLDWAAGGWDSLGSDIGGLLYSKIFFDDGIGEDCSDIIRNTVSGFIEGAGIKDDAKVREELMLAANLHFVIRFFPWAVSSSRKDLLSSVLKRAEHLYEVFR